MTSTRTILIDRANERRRIVSTFRSMLPDFTGRRAHFPTSRHYNRPYYCSPDAGAI
jgi:hypothetical protein